MVGARFIAPDCDGFDKSNPYIMILSRETMRRDYMDAVVLPKHLPTFIVLRGGAHSAAAARR